MKKAIFYFEPEWAFGSIHYELSKYLWAEGYNCHLLSWCVAYYVEEFAAMDRNIDLWVTCPQGYKTLSCVVPPEKCVIMAHAAIDLKVLKESFELELSRFKAFAVISEFLKEKSSEFGLSRLPTVTHLGINFDTFYNRPSSSLKTIGFAGSYYERGAFSSEDENSVFPVTGSVKRGYLVREAAERNQLHFRVAQHSVKSFISMPAFYRDVDSVVIASTHEGAGLPALEAGAAGKLVISTPVGHWNTLVSPVGGIELPFPEHELAAKLDSVLDYYSHNPDRYRDRCSEIQEHARSYDWKYRLPDWIALFES
jgi:glycosyltransferase involved in cell wall biosynthesis